MCLSWLEHEALCPEKRHATSKSNTGLFRASSSLPMSSSGAQSDTGYLPGMGSRGVKEDDFSFTLRSSDCCKEELKQTIDLP